MMPDNQKPSSSTVGNGSDDSKAMPPPPNPPVKILEAEINALGRCLKDAVIRTGQIYGFYADTHKLGIEKYAPSPPRSLTAALGRDIEKYDQLCDSIEAHLLRAISVLQRDLRREEERVKAEERRKNAEMSMLPPPIPQSSSEPGLGTSHVLPTTEGIPTNPRNSPVLGVSAIVGRRPSAISISSLHRPQFPLKLDLSSTSLRITEEEAAMFSKGLASPVTLAPKSARLGPNEFSSELLAAFANASVPSDDTHTHPDINLNLPEALHIHPEQPSVSGDVGIGDSSDKPIELDLDAMDIDMGNMTDLFGDPTETGEGNNVHDGLFSPVLDEGEGEGPQDGEIDQPQKLESRELDNFGVEGNQIFATFSANDDPASAAGPSMLQSDSTSVPSPGTLMAQFSASGHLLDLKSPSSTHNVIPDTASTFDLTSMDYSQLASGLFSSTQDSEINFPMDMDAYFNMGTGLDEKLEGESSTQNSAQA
ncbi:hypothetical protein B0H34DRAFT_34400 [Crassisporium funariophilum]|nr:hypothetical protein B0H34DRAFT_34400 [Crassisporium funariophilum]